MTLLLVFFAAGLILGSLSIIEWIVTRLVKLWVSGVIAGLVACVLAVVFAGVLKVRRLMLGKVA